MVIHLPILLNRHLYPLCTCRHEEVTKNRFCFDDFYLCFSLIRLWADLPLNKLGLTCEISITLLIRWEDSARGTMPASGSVLGFSFRMYKFNHRTISSLPVSAWLLQQLTDMRLVSLLDDVFRFTWCNKISCSSCKKTRQFIQWVVGMTTDKSDLAWPRFPGIRVSLALLFVWYWPSRVIRRLNCNF